MSKKVDRAKQLARVADLFNAIKKEVHELAPASRFRDAAMTRLDAAETSTMRAIFSDPSRSKPEEPADAQVPA